MILDMSKPSLKMRSVESACNEAPASSKKAAALKHLVKSENARKRMSEAETNIALDAAKRARE